MNNKVFKTIYYIFLGAIGLIAVLLIVSAFPISGNIKFLTVLSGSMEPAIKMGSVVLVKPMVDYKIGDVITFGEISKIKTPITHRIYEIKVQGSQPVYITKGDANNGPDIREITQKDILGKVLFSVPYLGYAVDAAKKPFGFALIIIVPATLIIFNEIKKIYEEVKKRKKKENADA
ncbi:MAG: signal peptidase I [Patescibacteria group bacterium]